MSATGSVNLIVCFSLSRPFAPICAENLQRLLHQSFVLGRLSLAYSPCRSERPTTVYQEDFETPGISPRSANCRKHKRQMPNFRRKARGRPHNLQRLCFREENLGFGSLLSRAF